MHISRYKYQFHEKVLCLPEGVFCLLKEKMVLKVAVWSLDLSQSI